MKKMATLLLLLFAALSFKTIAQTTTCNADFTYQFLNGNTVKFTPAVPGEPNAVKHDWDFGDGYSEWNVVSPTHSYVANGTYSVKHVFSRYNPNGVLVCRDSVIKTLTIQQAPCNLQANFIWSADPQDPLHVFFGNTTINQAPTDSLFWSFGDGTTSTSPYPDHHYANAGTYTVCLRVKRMISSTPNPCVSEICKTITVQAPCNLVVNFTWNASTANPLMIEFHNQSTPLSPTDSIKWTFGDGSSSTAVSPNHTYNQPGTYHVCLIIKKANTAGTAPCIREICKDIVVQAPPCNLVVDFTWNASTANPLLIEFHAQITPLNNTDSIFWTFGDGGTGNAVNNAHIYSQPGTYNVCLIVKRSNTCIREVCKTITVQAPPCNLVADFTWNATTANPLTIEFHNQSTPLSPTDSITWTFGDGSSSTAVNPNHTYNQPGTYMVCLRVKKNNNTGTTPCVREICKTITVQAPCNLVVNFSWTATATNPLLIVFQNLSTPLNPTDSIRWTFGDGTSSTDVHPTHQYSQPGTYTVCLVVKKNNNAGTAPCIREICKVITVQAPPCNLQVYFTWNASTANPLLIEFHNQSTPLSTTDSIRWTFGDGTSSTAVHPTHLYSQPGTYHVCLIVKKNNATGTAPCIREFCKDIVVQAPPCNIQVAYSWQVDPQNYKKVNFTNLTVTPTPNAIATWTFGDGTSASSWNAVHEYTQPGTYWACLKVQYSNTCIRTYCDTIFIVQPTPSCNQLSNFTFERYPNDVQKYKFTPAYINTTLQYTWTFGDGTGSHDPIATHRYAHPGTYTACLTVWNGPNCASTTCKTITVQQQINCDSVHVSYTYQRTAAYPNKLYFFANSNMPILDQVWTITRIPASTTTGTVTLHQNNPTYIFPDTGSYRVCLKAITAGGCVKEYCSIIRIEPVQSNVCELQAFPNPTSSVVNVNVFLPTAEMIHTYIYNSANVLVKEKHQQGVTGSNLVTVPVQDLVAGLYNMKIIYGNKICYARFQKL